MGYFDYHRRKTTTVHVGNVDIGSDFPLRLQSMTSTSTMDTDASVAQISRIVSAGADIVRLTAQGVREAENLGKIRKQLRAAGIDVPLVADIHFNPRAAFAAAGQVEKVRINPGNFVDPGRTFRKIEYTDEEYAVELQRIDAALTPFLELCRKFGTAIRIGVNHGSLSDRIMSRYGDTPAGMTESAMEFLRVCRRRSFDNVVISIKASNVVVMVETVRRLVRAMSAEGMHYPLHLGVTEAGDGEDGRIKSAVGIGTLLLEGIGDTIRVSLSEAPEAELPVARMIADYIYSLSDSDSVSGEPLEGFDLVSPVRRESISVGIIGGGNVPVVATVNGDSEFGEYNRPDIVIAGNSAVLYADAALPIDKWGIMSSDQIVALCCTHTNFPGCMQAAMHEMMRRGFKNPVIAVARYRGVPPEVVAVRASVDLGALLLNGFRDGICIDADTLSANEAARIAFGILQSTRLRMSKTEYVACPGCGRTMFDLQDTLHKVREATSHLRGLKIGVMGCIVNGPGEMSDADYGYVGAGVGKVSLYKGKECIERNIPASEAVEHLIALIKREGDWK